MTRSARRALQAMPGRLDGQGCVRQLSSSWDAGPLWHVMRRRENERVCTGRGRLDGPEDRVVDVDELPELREVATHEREVMLGVEISDRANAIECVAVADLCTERVARIGRVRDQIACDEHRRRLVDVALLRVVRMDIDESHVVSVRPISRSAHSEGPRSRRT